ncbi:unnamed protein product [Heterobilharzia americana]|nr:unnamed protein product [Heterobilharzia americana]
MPIQLDDKPTSNFERLEKSSMRNGVHSVGEHPEGISPLEAVNLYRDNLSLHERKEILRYDKIFYVGCTAEKHSASNCFQFTMQKFGNHASTQQLNDKLGNINNLDENQSMFNDSDNFYRIIQHDHIAYRYEILSLLGKGSFGQVVSAYDHMKGCKVALKIIRTEPRFTRQAREEIRILETLRNMRDSCGGETNRYDFPIIHLYEYFTFRKHICMTFELLNINLYDLLKLNKFTGLPRDRVRRICFQVLKALQFIQKAGIIHCDLKPENVLLVWPQSPESDNHHHSNNGQQISNNHHGYSQKYYPYQSHNVITNTINGTDSMTNLRSMYQGGTEQKDYVKLIDFGSSCFQKGQPYPYIQSRFYRAPEILLRLGYDQAIDIWSFGCLVAELINGLPLFPGEDEADQMACIMEVLGLPHPSLLRNSSQIDRYFIEFKCDKLKPSTLEFIDKKGVRVNRDTVYLPRYCSIRYPENDKNNSPQLLPGLSKRGGHVRGIPNSLPLLQAITQSRLRRYRRKDTRSVTNLSTAMNSNTYNNSSNKISEEEEAYFDKDNELVVDLVSSCLSWLPNERIQPNKAIVHSWFSHFYNSKPHTTGFRTPFRVRSMEVTKFAPSKLTNDFNERHLTNDYRNGRDSLSREVMLNKSEGLRNCGQQKPARLSLTNNQLISLDIPSNNASLNDLTVLTSLTTTATTTTTMTMTRVRNANIPFMVDAQISPIREDELKRTQRNSQITIVQQIPSQNQAAQSQLPPSLPPTTMQQQQQQPAYFVTVSSSPIISSVGLSQNKSGFNSISSCTNKSLSSTANRRVTLIYPNNNTNNNTVTSLSMNDDQGMIDSKNEVENSQNDRLLAVNSQLDHLNNKHHSIRDDITINNTVSSIAQLNNAIIDNSSTSSSSSSSSGIDNTNVIENAAIQHSILPPALITSYNEVIRLNDFQSDIIQQKIHPPVYTKPETIYQSKKLLDRNSTTYNNNSNMRGFIGNINNIRPLSEFNVNNYNHSNEWDSKTHVMNEQETESPTLLITGYYSSTCESTPHLANLITLNQHKSYSAMSKMVHSPNRYSYSNLHQSIPFISSLTIDKSLNNSMNNIVNIPKMKLAYDVQQSTTLVNNIKKRYSEPTRSRVIDIPQTEYEIPISDNDNNNSNNHTNGYNKQDIHFIPVTSTPASTSSLSSSYVMISNESGQQYKLNTNNTALYNNHHYETPSNNNNNDNNNQLSRAYQSSQQNQAIQLQQHEQFNRYAPSWLSYINTSGNTTNTTTTSNNNNNTNRNLSNFSRNYTELNDTTNNKNNCINGYDPATNHIDNISSMNTTITLPEIAPKPSTRTKLVISNHKNSGNNNNSDTNNTVDQNNPLRWHKSKSTEEYSSTSLYGPQPYSQPNTDSSHRVIVQHLPQHSINNTSYTNNNNGYMDQIQPYYTQYQA